MRKTKSSPAREAVRPNDAAEAGHDSDAGQAGVEATLDLALARVHLDITRISALVDANKRVMTEEEAATMTGYLRALGGIVRDRSRPGASRVGGKTWDELVEMAKQIPELREALGG